MPKSNNTLVVQPVQQFAGAVRVPGSKSITNRALLMAALSDSTTDLKGALISDDTQDMVRALKICCCKITWPDEPNGEINQTIVVDGSFLMRLAEPIQKEPIELDVGNAGTAMRPLTAVLSAGRFQQQHSYLLKGTKRMHERPIGDLVDAVRELGGQIEYVVKEGYPPLVVTTGTMGGGNVTLRADKSSQYLSALLIAAPLTGEEVHIKLATPLVSSPYVQMTLGMMTSFGVKVEADVGMQNYHIPAGRSYQSPGTFKVEPDATSASYFLAAGAISGGPITLEGFNQSASIQGDASFASVLKRMGAKVLNNGCDLVISRDGPLQGIDIDMNEMPDAAMTLAVTALFAKGETHIRNIANWRIKETNRLQAMATELRKVGAKVKEYPDSLSIKPPEKLNEAEIDTYDDHRMAMCFSLVALGGVSVHIRDPSCVNKTFPGYFEYFERLCHR